LTAVFGLIGSFSAGALADRIRPKPVLIAFQIVHALAFAEIVWARSYPAFLVGSAAVGLGLGSATPLHPFLIARLFGPNLVGRVLGAQGAIGFPFLLAAAPLAGWLADRQGSRSVVFVAALGVLSVAILLLAALGSGSRARAADGAQGA
jgi:MFS family permease